MEFYIADTHLGHENILKECRPQFESIEQMNATIIDNINRRTTRSDLLYIVGDFAFRSRTSPVEFLEAIKPKKILIVGNHDRDWLKRLTEEEKQRHFVGIYDQYSIKRNGLELHFNHFPQLAWSRSHYFAQSLMICGHIHNARNTTTAARLFPQVDCQFNAGVDVNGFEPVTLSELVERNHAFYGRTYDDERQELLSQAVAKLMQYG